MRDVSDMEIATLRFRFGGRLPHEVPPWTRDGSLYHVRIRCGRVPGQAPLTDPVLAPALLESVRFYEERGRWHALLWLLMPDHLHALLAFPPNEVMSRVVGDWKRFHAKRRGVIWQEGYFDHRVRNDDGELARKAAYIWQNPVASGLCTAPGAWPWVYPTLQDSTP